MPWFLRKGRALPTREAVAPHPPHGPHAPPEDYANPLRARVIEEIQSINPTAETSYLMGFRRDALELYLKHLTESQKPRDREAVWTRPGDTPAIVWRHATD